MAVTVARYETPAHTDIDKVFCSPFFFFFCVSFVCCSTLAVNLCSHLYCRWESNQIILSQHLFLRMRMISAPVSKIRRLLVISMVHNSSRDDFENEIFVVFICCLKGFDSFAIHVKWLFQFAFHHFCCNTIHSLYIILLPFSLMHNSAWVLLV